MINAEENILNLEKNNDNIDCLDSNHKINAHDSQIKSDNQVEKPSKKNKLDFSKKKHMAFKFMYNGKNYEGLVPQNHTENTVEAHIIKSLLKANLIQSLESCNFARCGRTDAGVSSTGNVFSLYLRHKEGMSSSDYVKILNNLLPNDILIIGASEVDDSFDARFSCLYREYKYFFLKAGMNIDKMKEAVKKLEGVHNFRNFCKIDKSDQNYLTKNYERRIYEFTIDKYEKLLFPSQSEINITNDYFEMYYVTIKGSAFLWHQVRCMMGIVFLIGKGLEEVEIIDNMFDVSSDKVYNFEIASETPLVLSDCQFEGVTFHNTIENYADNFFSVGKLYEENLTQLAINSFFFRNLTSLMCIQSPVNTNMNKLSAKDENGIVSCIENKFRRKKKYTKLLNHKTNRIKK